VPVPLALEEFAKLMGSVVGGLTLSSTSIDLSGRTTEEVFQSLAHLLHVLPVEQGARGCGCKLLLLTLLCILGDTAASYYGRSVQGHHVLVLAKVKAGKVMAVDLKSTDGILGGSLLSEINQLFKKY